MELDKKKNKFFYRVRALVIFLSLLTFVLLVNAPVISFDMMYPEQPLIYLANQKITSVIDLINVYLHPQLFHITIPFFRPSGHFLLYQLLTPIIGWHNTKGFIIVNLIFLALSGYLMIKLYRLLFQHFIVGGYVAFSIYLMHPALSLSRLTVLHFEFAYVFFVVCSLYCFVLFCQRNGFVTQSISQKTAGDEKNTHYFSLLGLATLFYIIAVTFKEPAILLGPVLLLFLAINLYQGQSLRQFIHGLWQDKKIRKIILLIFTVSATLAIYLTLCWPTLSHPLRNNIPITAMISAANAFIKELLGIHYNFLPATSLDGVNMLWRDIIFPPISHVIIAFLILMTVIGSIFLFSDKSSVIKSYKKSLLFLFLSSLIFILLPIGWAMGLPWHLNLTLLCLSLIIGFNIELTLHHIVESKRLLMMIGLLLALLIGLAAISVNKANINRYLSDTKDMLALSLAHNAVLFPPPIKNQLNADSMIVIEDSIVHDDYLLGTSIYPLYVIPRANFSASQASQKWNFLKYDVNYNGTLFRWAYLMPTLKEAMYPFQIADMSVVPNEVIYNWLQHFNNIFCLGYDKKANWQDKTAAFKVYLLKEKTKRKIITNSYNVVVGAIGKGKGVYAKNLPFPDPQLCQYACDQDKQCSGFTYMNAEAEMKNIAIRQCVFYHSSISTSEKGCPMCSKFVKFKQVAQQG